MSSERRVRREILEPQIKKDSQGRWTRQWRLEKKKAAKEAKQPLKGLLEKRLPEPVKRQMCELLHYFCDCELKHRIEAIVSFSDNFVSKLQFNQKYRYNELMLALNMSAAVTAKKTKSSAHRLRNRSTCC
ncbi:hypothetical protein fugu_016629 [Takifugu bimaculatus]|uniref:Ryanodine receptor junctional solenoid domain-containing protein n=1 Tax=Takifugu bimaculatus TaxID=433685 RepID=A0A4Z2BVC9_9TELE|nr:hypothetical protein fugu_016629 [Takifugu bimaculatus]